MTGPDILAVLLSDPTRAENLPLNALPEILGQVARLEATLRLRLNQPFANGSPPELPPAKTEPDRLLTAEQVAEVLQRSTRYVYDHSHKWSFTRRLGTRTLRFSERGFHRWLERQ